MNNNLIQAELDMAEEQALAYIFGDAHNPQFNSTIKSFLALTGKDPVGMINNYLSRFETIVTPLLKENGYVDGAKLSQLIKIKFNRDIIIEDFRLVEIVRSFEPWIRSLGMLIR